MTDDAKGTGNMRLRRTIAICLCALGAASAFYGYAFHSRAVLVEREVEQADTPVDADTPADMSDIPIYDQDGNLIELPPLPPEEPLPAGTEAVFEVFLEHIILRDVTVGGIERIGGKDLKRTYIGKPPEQCPT